MLIEKYIVYRAKNIETGESYIGSSKRALRDRINSHYTLARYTKKCGKKLNKFLRVILAFSRDSFTWNILSYTNDRKSAVGLENSFMVEFDTVANGYNSNKAYECNNGVDRKDLKDHTIYHFYNIKTNEEYIGKQSDFIKLFNVLQPSVNIIVTKGCLAKGWCLYENINKVKKTKYNTEIFHFYNLDSTEEYKGIVNEFIKANSIKSLASISKLINTGIPAYNWCRYEDRNNFEKINIKWRKLSV